MPLRIPPPQQQHIRIHLQHIHVRLLARALNNSIVIFSPSITYNSACNTHIHSRSRSRSPEGGLDGGAVDVAVGSGVSVGSGVLVPAGVLAAVGVTTGDAVLAAVFDTDPVCEGCDEDVATGVVVIADDCVRVRVAVRVVVLLAVCVPVTLTLALAETDADADMDALALELWLAVLVGGIVPDAVADTEAVSVIEAVAVIDDDPLVVRVFVEVWLDVRVCDAGGVIDRDALAVMLALEDAEEDGVTVVDAEGVVERELLGVLDAVPVLGGVPLGVGELEGTLFV